MRLARVLATAFTVVLGGLGLPAHAEPPQTHGPAFLWGDPVDGQGPATLWEAHPGKSGRRHWDRTASVSAVAKGVVLQPGETPTYLRWLIVRCAFAEGTPFNLSADIVQRQFDDPDKGVFSFFERQSGGLLTQEVLGMFDVQLPRTLRSYWYDSPSQNLPGFLSDTTDDCIGPLLAEDSTLAQASAVAVLYSDSIDGNAYGALTWLPVLGDDLRPMIFIPGNYFPLTLAHEVGHALRLPHTNNADRDGTTYDNAWDVMSGVGLNAVHDEALGLLPRGLHPYDAYTLGWADPSDVIDIDAADGPDRTETFDLHPRRMLRVSLGGTRALIVSHRPAGHADEGLRVEPAVFLDELDTNRPEPLWTLDAAVPTPTTTNTDTSYFTQGERYTLTDDGVSRGITVDVVTVSQEGARVRVHLGPPPPLPPPVNIFANQFESPQEQSAHAQ